MLKSSTFNLNPLLLHITEKPGNSPALLFLHGNSMSSGNWVKQMEDPKFSHYRLIAIDLPGHGDSSRSATPDKHYNLRGYAKALVNTIEEMSLEDYIIVGHSLGGNIAIEAIPMLRNCIGVFVIGAVIADGPTTISQCLIPHPASGYFFQPEVTEAQVAEAMTSLFENESSSTINLFAEDFMKTDPNCRLHLMKSMAEGRLSNNIEILRSAPMPVAYTIGALDRLMNSQHLLSIPLQWWTGKIVRIDQAGHTPHWETPDEFNTLLLDFVSFCKG